MSSLALPSDSTLSTLSDVQRRVLQSLAEGTTVTTAAAANGIHRTTIYHWIRTLKEFAAGVESAKAEYRQQLSDELKEMSATALATLRRLMTDAATPSAVKLKAALSVLERLPNGWILPEALTPAPPPQPVAADLRLLLGGGNTHETNPMFPQVARNAPCPCGSGLKHKRCCGAEAPPVLGG
jgi:transposase-like protein